jgi:hypothetical protein
LLLRRKSLENLGDIWEVQHLKQRLPVYRVHFKEA